MRIGVDVHLDKTSSMRENMFYKDNNDKDFATINIDTTTAGISLYFNDLEDIETLEKSIKKLIKKWKKEK
jgi:hypothetical protein